MTTNFESFVYAICSQLVKNKITKKDGSFVTPEDLIARTSSYIRINESLHNRFIEAIPLEPEEDYFQRLEYFQSFLDGSITAFLMAIDKDITFADNAITEALANALNINIFIEINSYILPVRPNAPSNRSVTITMTEDFLLHSDYNLSFYKTPSNERDLIVDFLNNGAQIAANKFISLIKKNPTLIRDVLRSSHLELDAIKRLIETEKEAINKFEK